jgi:sigma-B regulation protein RsbU (phosphoserine phosphatase)
VKQHLTHLGIAILVGVVASSFYAIAEWPHGFFNTLFIGGVIGAVIHTVVSAADSLIKSRVPARALPAVRVMTALVCGVVGSILGLVAGVRLLGGNLTFADVLVGRGRPFIVMATAITAFVGFGTHSFRLMRDRLRIAQDRIREQEWAERELQMARSVQTRLLPPPVTTGEGYAVIARNLPARLVAGDFYDVVRIEDGSIVVVIADVAGKGMGASLIMASVKSWLPLVAPEGVLETMRRLNDKLIAELAKREFVALLCARFVPKSGLLEFANAGCPDPYRITSSGAEPLHVGGTRLPLGLRSDIDYDLATVMLDRGDRALFLTDGIPEAPKPDGEPLGYERVAHLAGNVGRALGANWLDKFLASVREEVREGLEDDWTALLLERL